jgi:3-hydroxybutyryl-CoA dehydratase
MEELHGYYFEDLSVGMSAVFAKTLPDADVVMFAGISGDTNPVHLNQLFAEGTLFKECVAHGMLSASFISTVLGTRLPGPGCVYLSQSLRFLAPVKVGDTVVARATVDEIDTRKQRITLGTICMVADTVVVEGQAVVRVSSRTQ